MEDKKKYSEKITEQLIELLEKGTAPWQIPWKPGQGDYLPNNPITKRRYSGINSLVLQFTQMLKGYDDNRWLTYKQAQSIDAEVKKGEKATTVQYWKFYDDKKKLDENGKPVLNADGQSIIERYRLERPKIFFSSVFNADQIKGLPLIDKKEQLWTDLEQAEAMLQATKANIIHTDHKGAFYRPIDDTITIPSKERFAQAADYYATALHEMGHWTGHETRLNRDIAHPFGSVEYAKEELRAEIASMMLGSDLGIGHDPSNHASYVGSWIQILKDDSSEIFRASSDAEHIRNYLNKLVNQQTNTNTQENEIIDSIATHHNVPVAIPIQYKDIATLTAANIQEVDNLMTGYTREDKDYMLMIAESLKSYRNGNILETDFMEYVREKMGICFLPDWNGKVKIQGYAEKQGEDGSMYPYPVDSSNDPDKQIGVWSVYTQQNDNNYSWVADLISHDEVGILSNKLRLIDALAVEDEFEKSVKLTRFTEDQTLRNPHSTFEDINAAIDKRKDAETSAQIHNDTIRELSMNTQTKIPQTGTGPELHPVSTQSQENTAEKRLYLIVPYVEKEQAKAVGAKWDKAAKSWYADRNKVDLQKIEKWLPKNAVNNVSIHTPQEQFTQFLSSLGAVTSGQQIIMNGKKHRIRVPGDKGQEKSGVYFGHLDGKPAGYFKNFRTCVESRWKSDTVQLTDSQKQALIAEAEEKLKLRREVENQVQQNSAKAVKEFLNFTQSASETGHAYLTLKNVSGGGLRVVGDELEYNADPLIRIAQNRKESKQLRDKNPEGIVFTKGDLLIPVQDIAGTVWGVQIIQADGTKFYSKNARKENNFYIVGSEKPVLDALKDAKAIVIAEGYATADTLSKAIQLPVVMAFDSGNLPAVAKTLREQFPDKPFVIAGDDDYQLELKNGANSGKLKAFEAAELVDGIAVLPTFAPGEQAEATLNDFNDLANKSVLGIDAVRQQVGSIIERVSQQTIQASLTKLQIPNEPKQQEIKQKRALVR